MDTVLKNTFPFVDDIGFLTKHYDHQQDERIPYALFILINSTFHINVERILGQQIGRSEVEEFMFSLTDYRDFWRIFPDLLLGADALSTRAKSLAESILIQTVYYFA